MGLEISFSMFGNDYLVPDTIVNVWLVVAVLLILGYITKRKIESADVNEAPTGFLNVMETVVESVEDLVVQNMGESGRGFTPYILSLMAFLLLANLSGLLGLTPPTSDYSVTLTLALITFALVQIVGVKTSGLGGYIKGFGEPMVLLTPLNIIGELANPVSLSFRLFGNILSGAIIMTLLYQALGFIAPIITPFLHAYFDLFAGVLQTFIFGMLTMIFIGGNLED